MPRPATGRLDLCPLSAGCAATHLTNRQQPQAVCTLWTQSVRLQAAFAGLLILLLLLVCGLPANAQTFTVLHTFQDGQDGGVPNDGLTMDRAGNLYGDTGLGGMNHTGSIFKLSHHGQGWVLQPLYNFGPAGHGDGWVPSGGVVIGPNGTLYGTTVGGGNLSCDAGGYGCGTVYNVHPGPTRPVAVISPWYEVQDWVFNGPLAGGADGAGPYTAGVIFDHAGNMYGTTESGGSNNCSAGVGCGTVFELSPSGSAWVETILYNFTFLNSGGFFPESPLIMDSAGNLYGTTWEGGTAGQGTVFELSPSGSGWTEKILYSFTGGSGGSLPTGGLLMDPAGNLFGTTSGDAGTVFELSPNGSNWNYALVHAWSGGGCSFSGPTRSLTMDAAGSLYGTTACQGAFSRGSVFKFSFVGGTWQETVLYSFTDGADGGIPQSTVVMDASGNLYGTTREGGVGCADNPDGCGVVWEITP